MLKNYLAPAILGFSLFLQPILVGGESRAKKKSPRSEKSSVSKLKLENKDSGSTLMGFKVVNRPAPTQESGGSSFGKKKVAVKPYEDMGEQFSDVAKIKEQIDAIDLILKNDRQVDSKVELYVQKSYLLYNLGRKLRFHSSLKEEERKSQSLAAFDQSQSINKQLLGIDEKKPLLSKARKAIIHYIRGSIAFEMNQEDLMVKEYLTSLEYDSTTPQASSMSLVIAEVYFDRDQFDKAIEKYQSLYTIHGPQQKGIADYKTAWCFLIQKKYDKAEFHFVRAARIKPQHLLTEDAIKDLAYVSTQVRSEDENLEFAKATFGEVSQRGPFLLALIRNLFAIDKKKIPYKIFNEAFKINKNLKEKLQVLSMLVSFERREYPTKGQIVAFEHLYNVTQKIKADKAKAALNENKNLGYDLEVYIRLFVDGYVQKIQAQKITDRGQFIQMLYKLVPYYLKYFAEEKDLYTYYALWMDIAKKEGSLSQLDESRKHWELEKVSFPNSEMDAKIDNRQRVEIIAMLEKANENPDRLQVELLTFLEKYPNDVNALAVAKRLSEIYLAQNKSQMAIPYLKIIYDKESTSDNFYNLKLAAFQLGQYEEIVEDPELKKHESNERVIQLVRDTRLRQATKSYEKNDFGKYEENIRTYLDTKPDQKQSLIVYSDYFSKLIDRNEKDKFCSEYTRMDPSIRSKGEIAKFAETTIDQSLSGGLATDCPALEKYGSAKALNYKVALLRRAQRLPASPEDFNVLKDFSLDERKYYLSLVALSEPKMAVEYFEKNGTKDVEDKKIFFLARKMHAQSEKPVLSSKESVLFKDFIPQQAKNPIESKIPKQVESFFFPTSKMSLERYSKVLEDVFYRAKLVRKTFLKESPLMPSEQKIAVLGKMIETEKKVAEVLINSPAPEGMDEKQLTQYRGEVKKAADDYTLQAEEYQKIKDTLSAQVEEDRVKLEALKVPEIPIDKWFWPTGSLTEVARQTFKDRGLFAALVYLEYQRTGAKINDVDYAMIRAGLLLSVSQKEFMRYYVRDELAASGLNSVVTQWRSFL